MDAEKHFADVFNNPEFLEIISRVKAKNARIKSRIVGNKMKITLSPAMTIVLEYLEQKEVFRLQMISKSFYNLHVPKVIEPLSLPLKFNQISFPMLERAKSDEARERYFNGLGLFEFDPKKQWDCFDIRFNEKKQH